MTESRQGSEAPAWIEERELGQGFGHASQAQTEYLHQPPLLLCSGEGQRNPAKPKASEFYKSQASNNVGRFNHDHSKDSRGDFEN